MCVRKRFPPRRSTRSARSLRAQALNEGKPEKIVDKMVEGRIEKYYKEVCLLEQPFVKDPDKSIAKLMGEVAKEIGAELNVVSFERFERGEGIEKRKDNFAEEIAAQMAAKKVTWYALNGQASTLWARGLCLRAFFDERMVSWHLPTGA